MNDWVRTKELLSDALELPAHERTLFLEHACREDAELRERVEALLEVEERARSFLETPALEDPDQWLPELCGLHPGAEVDGFRIERLVAVGGSSLVYEAAQIDPPRRVALKVLATDPSRPRAQRFVEESRVLAGMEHAGIAKVLAVGQLDEGGIPYLAVEWIRDARPLVRHANETGLGTLARLKLFLTVCDAVEHAHRRGIVHRDLKPANLLVDDEGRARVIDFGIAKELDRTGATRTGDVLGTVAYMSPEQCDSRPSEVDARADVYSLGVVLFELLTGRRPVDVEGRSLAEAMRKVREDPPRVALAAGLAVDLVAILSRALEKDPGARYATAGELAADLQRFLEHLPVDARPPAIGYHARLFVRRHRSRVLAGAALLLALLGGAATTTFQATRAAAAERRERARSEQVTSFLLSVLELTQPSLAGGKALPARSLLDDAGERLDTELADLPEERAEIHQTIAMAYRELGLLDDAARHLGARIDILRSLPATEQIELACALDGWGEVLVLAGRGADAERALREAEAIHARHPDLPPFLAAITKNRLAGALLVSGDLDGAEAYAAAALATYRATFGDEHRSVAAALRTLSDVRRAKGELSAAREASAEALAIELKEFGEDSLEAAQARGRLGCLLAEEERAAEARPVLERAIAGMSRFLPDEHPDLVRSRGALAELDVSASG